MVLNVSRNLCLENGICFVYENYAFFEKYKNMVLKLQKMSRWRGLYKICFVFSTPTRPASWPLRARLTRYFGKSAWSFVISRFCGRSGLGLWIVFNGLEYAGTLFHDCLPFFGIRRNSSLITDLDWWFGD